MGKGGIWLLFSWFVVNSLACSLAYGSCCRAWNVHTRKDLESKEIRSEYVDGIVLSRRRCFLEGRE